MKKNLVIVGTGLFGQLAGLYFEKFTNYQILAFACNESYKKSEEIYGYPLLALEQLEQYYLPGDIDIFIAIGYRKMNKIRQSFYEKLKSSGYCFANFIHPSVKICDSTHIGENVFIFEDNTVQPFTSIGNNTVLWSGNHIGHHSTIGEHSFISSHVVISGSCIIGHNVFIGVNATLHDSISVGDACLIGAGSIITKSTKPNTVYVAKSTKEFSRASDQINF